MRRMRVDQLIEPTFQALLGRLPGLRIVDVHTDGDPAAHLLVRRPCSRAHLRQRKERTLMIKLHRCPATFAKTGGHPCWRVQKALDEAGIEYEVVKQPFRRSKRASFAQRSGQRLVPALEFEDGTILREESEALAARIRDGRLR
jgi:glutaredoxin